MTDDELRACGRAVDSLDKARLITRLFKAWKKMPAMRLGQLVDYALDLDGMGFNSIDDVSPIYTIEDRDFIEAIERWVERYAHVR